MKNVIFFVVLAVLTVAALVGWNAIRNRPDAQPAVVDNQAAITPTSTPEVGTAVGRVGGMGSLSNSGSTVAGSLADSTKGSLGTSVSSTVTPVSGQMGATPTPTRVAVAPTTTPPPANSTVVTYTDNGFTPKSITVKSGTMLKFVNQSTKRMWVASAAVSGGNKLDAMNMGMSVGKSGTYEFQFTQTGTWGFYDQNNQSQTGTVTVN